MLLYIKEDQVIRDTHSSTKSLEQRLLFSLVRNIQALLLLQAFPPVLFLDPCRGAWFMSLSGRAEDEAVAQTGFHCCFLTFTLFLELVSFTTSNTLSLIPHI